MHVRDLEGISIECREEAWKPTFTEDDRIGRRPSLIASKETEEVIPRNTKNSR